MARRGDPSAMQEFIRASHHEVWSLCAHLVDPQSADDLAQETFLRVFRGLSSFRRESSARTWVLSIARRACMDELRSRIRRRRRDARLVDLRREDEVAADVAVQVEVQALLSGLSPERRSAFVLTQLLGLSYEETAQVCSCAVGTIRSRVARARADLITALAGETTGATPARTRRAAAKAASSAVPRRPPSPDGGGGRPRYAGRAGSGGRRMDGRQATEGE
jgi:RNA polymerase sigma-70 factor, ECF subfamily